MLLPRETLTLLLVCGAVLAGPAAGRAEPGPDPPFQREEAASPVLEPLPDGAVLRVWIAEMKSQPRGPFQRIRWFCNDGSVHPPRPYACAERGGGVQHGEWSERVKRLRAHGFFIGNVLADLDPQGFTRSPGWKEQLKQILLEQFLIEADDGWILRQARFYPGALQVENENDSGRKLLLALTGERKLREADFLLLREAARFLPHGRQGAPLTEMRQLARIIENQDPDFNSFRVKLHIQPDARDAEKLRRYAAEKGSEAQAEAYQRLATLIDQVFQPRDLAGELRRLAPRQADPELSRLFGLAAGRLAVEQDLPRRFALIAEVMEQLRLRFPQGGSPSRLLELLDLSLDLEQAAFQGANLWLQALPANNRQQRLQWLRHHCRVIYGLGLLSRRQLQALEQSLEALQSSPLPAARYQAELDYLGRIAEWAESSLYFQFHETIERLQTLDPLFGLYLPDRLRGSPLVSLLAVLESLQRDAGRLLGLSHRLLGAEVAGGLRALNPGLARGPLRSYRPGQPWQREAIYLLPETLAELPPVAGILSEGHGNALSHIQLLARNLGIPNVALERNLAQQLAALEGQMVVLAVSPAGVVELHRDSPRWDEVFRRRQQGPERLLRPDLAKLDLSRRELIPLRELRAADSGRSVGPKAANLGELKFLYPEYVTEGLALPFGLFRAYLEQPMEPGGPTVFAWLQQGYRALGQIEDAGERAAATSRMLQRLRDWLIGSQPGREFRDQLRAALLQAFGSDGSYGVFVRSDTNVEDLPGFSGAGLNLTLPNVVGFENILRAILQVWASPFTDRAYQWRQSHMEQPEHVYVSVLLLKSVAADKSGVMVTADVEGGQPGMLTVAVSEGVGGAVEGQRSEELLIERGSGRVRLLAQAAEPRRQVLLPAGGVARVAAGGPEQLLSEQEIAALLRLADSLPERFPRLLDASGQSAPADVEFGFVDGHLALFQIRPFLESSRARRDLYFNQLDLQLRGGSGATTVNLEEFPREAGP